MTTSSGGAGPLAGIRVLEIATVIMGPYAGQMLGDLGADVVKIETDAGDGSRIMGGGPHPELSGIALNLHRNKRSIVIDLKSAAGRDVVLRLLETCDVVVTNLRPAPLERLGLDHDSLVERFPRLVFCQAQGYRSDSNEGERPAYDDIIQADAGYPQLSGMAFGETRFLPTIVADKVAGLFITQGVLAALFDRERTGLGQRVEVPMFDAALSFNLVEHLAGATIAGQPTGYARILTPHRGPHRTTDGYVAMMPYTDRHWQVLFENVDRLDLLERPCFASHRVRITTGADEVYGLLAGIVATRSSAEWIELCTRIGVPVAAVSSLDEIVDDPARHRGVIRERDHPVVGAYREIRQPVVFGRSGTRHNEPAPRRGQHAVEVLRDAGFGEDEIDDLLSSGAVGTMAPTGHAPPGPDPATSIS